MSSAGNNNKNDSDDSDDNQLPQIPYRRDRTPSIVVQSLGLSFHKDSNINESIELPADEEDSSQNSNSSETTDQKSSTSGIDDPQNAANCDSLGGSTKGSLSSLQNSSPGVTSPVRGLKSSASKVTPAMYGNSRRLSLNIGSTAPRRQSLTVDGLASFANSSGRDPNAASVYSSGNATGSLRNKVALKPGHSLMGWIRLASTAKDLAGTQGKIIEVTPEDLAKHDKEDDCWVALKGNVYNVTTYLQYHPGGVEELMRGAGRDATELFNEVHRWVNYESILAKCLVGPYKIESPLTPSGRVNFATISGPSSPTRSGASKREDPTVAQKPPRRQSIALTVPSPNKYQSLLLSNNSSASLNQIQQPPTYMFVQDKNSVKLKVLDLTTLPIIRSRHLISDLIDSTELHLSVILSTDWLYRVHLRLDQPVDELMLAEMSNDNRSVTIQLNKKESGLWNKMGVALDLNDSLCETTLADKFFRSCQLVQKDQLTHDTYLFQFKLMSTLMYIPIGWHVLIREHQPKLPKATNGKNDDSIKENYDDYRMHKNYTAVLPNILDNNGFTDESGFMDRLCFIIKIYPNGVVTSKLNQLKIGDSVDISDYQSIDFDIESRAKDLKHWVLLAAGTGITPFCRTISYLLSQSEDVVKSVTLIYFNKTQKDIILNEQFRELSAKNETRFKVIHVLSNEQEDKPGYARWSGKRGRVNKDLISEFVDNISPDELELLACGPRAFTQLVKSIATELNLQEKLYIFHG